MTGEKILDIVRGIYSCDSQKYQQLLRPWQYDKSIGPAQSDMAMCNHKKTNCMKTYLKQCSNASSKVSKIPRISIGLASKLLLEFRNLKIIHLLRDPRAVMNSRYKLGWTPVPGGAVSLCTKMKKDYQQSVKLRRLFPGRIHTVFYEDMAQNFEEIVKEIYSFLGYQLNAKEQIRLNRMTSSSKNGNAGSTQRRNSTLTARAWRYSINTKVLIENNKACSDLYQLLGYPQLGSKTEARNTSVPLRITVK
ncbi:carbohydrate sulfotransferase 1-like [Argopecten irradians]|uniref:carbohydrate sulfotransferase 1-like n=1 Tax=Argopecten irradians TaxID=31199 RepID=UPI0037212412